MNGRNSFRETARLTASDQQVQRTENAEQCNRGQEGPSAAKLMAEQNRHEHDNIKKNGKACGIAFPMRL